MMTSLCAELAESVGALFVCEDREDHVRIRTPFLYPDGDVIDIFAKNGDSTVMLTDFGETLRWLRMQTVSGRRSPKQDKLIQDVLLNHGVELFRGMLTVRVHDASQLAASMIRIAQACLRIADLWFTFRARAVESVTDEVADLFSERSVRYERNIQLPGRSGRIWRPDFHTRTEQRSALVNVLSTGSSAAARGVVEHVFTQWHDLSHMKVGPEGLKFVSLFDDTMNVWSDYDLKLLSELSEISFWSKPDEVMERIAA
jgi:hypothetical protein